MKTYSITIIAKFIWVEILKISQTKFVKYKKFGVPSKEFDFSAWEEYIDDLECNSESSGFIEFCENIKFVVSSSDNTVLENTILSANNFNFLEIPSQQINEEGKFYLVRIQATPNTSYYINISDVFDRDKLLFKLRSKFLPAGELIRSLSASYDGEFFYYESDSHLYKESTVYLVDSKGNKFLIESQDEMSNKNSIDLVSFDNYLTDWYLGTVNPVRIGRYEVETGEKVVWPMPPLKYAEWNGNCWLNDLGASLTVLRWRGLNTLI